MFGKKERYILVSYGYRGKPKLIIISDDLDAV